MSADPCDYTGQRSHGGLPPQVQGRLAELVEVSRWDDAADGDEDVLSPHIRKCLSECGNESEMAGSKR